MSGFKNWIKRYPALHAVAKSIYRIFILFSLGKIWQKKSGKIPLYTVAFNSAMSKASVIPTIMFYYSGNKEQYYQLKMWLQPFKECGFDFYVCLKNTALFKELDADGIKAVSIPFWQDLEWVSTTDTRAVFYVNNMIHNVHMIRQTGLMHVQLLHGDSDKPPSFNPMTQIYDKIFVAGQAAMERYQKNSVFIPKDKFVIVSRPQLTMFDRKQENMVGHDNNIRKTILFCTTWRGHSEAHNMSSIDDVYKKIVSALEAGLSVIFRPHPLSIKDAKDCVIIDQIRDLLLNFNYETDQFGRFSDPSAEQNIDEVDNYINIMQMSDVLVSDLASTLNDWIYLDKPYFISINRQQPIESYRNSSLMKYGSDHLWRDDFDICGSIIKQDAAIKKGANKKMKEYLLGLQSGDDPSKIFSKAVTEVLTCDKSKFIENLYSQYYPEM